MHLQCTSLLEWAHEAIAQGFGIPFEAKNKYTVAPMPPGKTAASSPSEPGRWMPTGMELEAMEKMMYVVEESSCLMRCCLTILGGLNLRGLKLHFKVNPATGDALIVRRPCKLGGGCCCPLEMTASEIDPSGREVLVGRVREDFHSYCTKCCAACCICTVYHDVEVAHEGAPSGFEKRFSLRANICCYGRVNNCCGASCCKNDAVFDILDVHGNVVAHLQKTYAPTPDCSACCRAGNLFSNYILSFPPSSTAAERAMLVVAIFQLDYQMFEKRGGDKN